MRHLSVIVLVVLGPLLVGAEIHEATPAQLKRFTLVCDDRERTYFVHYPTSKLPAEPKAVVFVLHGGGGADAQEMARRTGMNHIADREDFIVVYPQGIDGQWNDGRGKTFRRPTDNRDVDDVRFISAVIDELVGKKLADPSRVYVMGLSNGGMMTHRLGIELGHRLAAIAPVIANLPENIATQKPTRPLPVLIMNGTDDPMMPWNGGPVRVLGREYGTVLSTDHTVRYWVEAAQLPPNPRTRVLEDRSPEDGCTVEVVEYSAAGNPVEVVLYRIRGGGHNLPGGNTPDRPVLLGRKCMDIVGVEVIWSFFKKHVLPKNAPTQPAAGSKRAAADWRPKVTQVNDPQANNFNAEFTGDGRCMVWIEGVGSLSTILVCLAAPAQTQQPTSRGGLAERFKQLDRNGDGNKRLLVAEPDGNRFNIEQVPAAAIRAAATRAAATSTPKPHKEEVAEQRPGEPPLKKMPDNDATRDAAGRGQLFESIVVPGFTSIQEGMNGLSIVDLNKDGLLDIVATYSAPAGTGGSWGAGEKLRVFINEGNFTFRQHAIRLLDSRVTPEAFGRGQVPVLADFNGDGFLDLFVTRHAQMQGGQSNPRDQKIGNGLYISDGAWDVFRDVSAEMGIQNEKAYNRQPSIGDVNRDGWLDIAIGCDNIGNAAGGVPHNRLYVFKPGGPRFEDGRFEDIAGTDLVPDFGGFYHDSVRDKAGPDINLRDLDNDGDLDLIQSYHVDIRDPALPFSPVEYRQGVFCWKNLLAETGELRFEKVTGNGLACEARLKLNDDKKTFTAVGKAPGLPYISLADVDNDGLIDVLAVGPASPRWAPRAEYVTGRFWRNKGGFQFQEATDAAGLSALNWVYRDWWKFFDAPLPRARPAAMMDPADRRPYFADAVFGDFDNDGWVDFVVLDRSEMQNPPSRATLFMNTGNGTFEPKPTTFSGLDGTGICGEAADLNNDGLLDLVLAADPDNSGIALSMDRYESKVYWNTGLHGARENQWLRLRFYGVKDAELIGARVLVYESGRAGNPNARPLGMRTVHPNHSYKSGGAMEVHFGLGRHQSIDVMVVLTNGTSQVFRDIQAGRFLEVNLGNQRVWAVPVAPVR